MTDDLSRWLDTQPLTNWTYVDYRDTGTCKECGDELGSGYICDDCETVEGWA